MAPMLLLLSSNPEPNHDLYNNLCATFTVIHTQYADEALQQLKSNPVIAVLSEPNNQYHQGKGLVINEKRKFLPDYLDRQMEITRQFIDILRYMELIQIPFHITDISNVVGSSEHTTTRTFTTQPNTFYHLLDNLKAREEFTRFICETYQDHNT